MTDCYLHHCCYMLWLPFKISLTNLYLVSICSTNLNFLDCRSLLLKCWIMFHPTLMMISCQFCFFSQHWIIIPDLHCYGVVQEQGKPLEEAVWTFYCMFLVLWSLQCNATRRQYNNGLSCFHFHLFHQPLQLQPMHQDLYHHHSVTDNQQIKISMKFGNKMLKPVICKHTANMNENVKFLYFLLA